MKLFNVITFCCAIFAGSAIADNKLPDWLSTSKKDYDLVRAFYLSGFASKAMNNQFGYHLPSELVNDFKDNEFATQEKWNTIPIVYGEIKSIRMVNNKPIVELFTPGENATPLNYIKLKILDSKQDSLLKLKKGDDIYAVCSGANFSLVPILSNCTPATDVIDAALSFSGEYMFPAFDSFSPTKQNVKYIFTNQDPVQMMNFIGYLSLVDTTKDKKKMDMVRKCTPWKPECSQQFVDVMEGFDSIMYKYEGEFKNYIELK
ncbi:TPA: hypothetical protein H5W91_003548 [Escherichia coli]|nr:hypothetical protein [Escherichia coli]HAL1895759.1 hypothetical protein [Escherichia coli]